MKVALYNRRVVVRDPCSSSLSTADDVVVVNEGTFKASEKLDAIISPIWDIGQWGITE